MWPPSTDFYLVLIISIISSTLCPLFFFFFCPPSSPQLFSKLSSDTPHSLSRWVIFLLWVYSVASRASKAPNSCSIIIQAAGGRQSILLLLFSSTRVAWWLARPSCNQKVTGLIPATAIVSISNHTLSECPWQWHCSLIYRLLFNCFKINRTVCGVIADKSEFLWQVFTFESS